MSNHGLGSPDPSLAVRDRRRRSRRRRDADGDTQDDGQVRTWDFIPAWQYDGWQVETGGLTVDEQESALSEVQSEAEAIEEAADDPSDR